MSIMVCTYLFLPVVVCLVLLQSADAQPIHVGPNTATLVCNEITRVPSNLYPCVGPNAGLGTVLTCKAAAESSVCDDELGMCNSDGVGSLFFSCKGCGVSIATTSTVFSGQCTPQSGTSLKQMLYASTEAGYYAQVRKEEPPRFISFVGDVTPLKANRNLNSLFVQRYTTMMMNYSSDESIRYPVLSVGAKIQAFDVQNQRIYPLSPQYLQHSAELGGTYEIFDPVRVQYFSRLNNSDYLVAEFNESRGELLSERDVGFKETAVAAASLRNTATVLVGLSTPLTQRKSFGASVTQDMWNSYVVETSFSYAFQGQSALKPFIFLNSAYNILVAGNNPFRAMFFQSPYRNYDQPMMPLLHPMKINAALKYSNPAVYPKEIKFISDLGYLMYLVNGDSQFVPFYKNQDNGLFGTQVTVPPNLLTRSNVQTFSSPAVNSAFNIIQAYLTSQHRVATYYSAARDNRMTIVYLLNSLKVRIWGLNDYGQFGLGAGTAGLSYDGTSELTLTLTGATAGENIQYVSIGENHTLILTDLGNVFVAGDTSFSLADCSSGSLKGPSFQKIPTLSQVTHAEAGWDFSMFIADSKKSVYVCGGKNYMSAEGVGGVQVKVSDSWNVIAASNYTKMCVGVYFTCVGVQTDIGAKWVDVRCWGAQDTVRFSSGSKTGTDPLNNIAICGVLNSDSKFSDPTLIKKVEDFSCGNHHAIFTMREQYNPNNQQVDKFPDFLSVFVCGSNYNGQLGAATSVRNGIAERAMYPLTSFAEQIYSTRAPNEYLYRNNGESFAGTDLSHTINYQVYETAAVQAVENSTFVFTRLKLFNTPNHLLSNVSKHMGHYPSTGDYHLVNFLYDAIRDVPLTSALLFDETKVYRVDFDLLKGLALVLFSNQTSSSSWLTYSGVVDGAAPATSNTSADLHSGASFFRNWAVLNRNVTTYVNGSAVMTIVKASKFVYLANGTMIALDSLSTSCSPSPSSAIIYCHEGSKTVVWGHTSASTPSGYSNILNSQDWVALYTSFAAFNISKPINASLSLPNFTDQDVFNAVYKNTNKANRKSYLCIPQSSPFDCSSLKWVETYYPIDSGNSFGKHISSFLSAVTTAALPELTVSTRFGYFLNGVSAFTTGQKRSTTTVDGVSPKGLISLQLYTLQYNADSVRESNFGTVCIFLKLGDTYYFVQLHADGKVYICSKVVNDTVVTPPPPVATPSPPPATPVPTNMTPSPPTPEPPTPAPTPAPIIVATWAIDYDNFLRITNLDPDNPLIAQYNSSMPKGLRGVEFDPNNVTYALSCNGGVAIKETLSSQPYVYSSYLYFTNTTIVKMLIQQRARNTTADQTAFHDSSKFYQTPLGCDGGFFEPVTPRVSIFDNFQARYYSNVTLGSSNFFVIEMKNSQTAANTERIPEYRYVIGATSFNVYRKSWVATHFDTRTFNPSTERGYMDVTTADEELVSIRVLDVRDPALTPNLDTKFYCSDVVFDRAIWYRFLLRYYMDSNRTEIYVDGGLVCRGNLLQSAHTQNIVGVYFGARNRVEKASTYFQIAEVGFCDTNPLTNPTHYLFPCMGNGRHFAQVGQTTTVSVSTSPTITVLPSDTATFSMSSSVSPTVSRSVSLSLNSSDTASPSPSMSVSRTRSISSSVNVSATSTVLLTTTHTDTVVRNLYLSLGEIDPEVITAHNIRRNGVQLILLLGDDVFDIDQDFANKAAVFLQVNSTVSVDDNPSGFVGSFRKIGFLSGRVNVLNRSHLILMLGPDIFYNSYEDEIISMKLLSPAVATKFPIPTIISFTIIGRGDIVDGKLRIFEGMAGVASLIAALSGAMPSATMHAATLSVLVNFRCFNSESGTLSFLQHPLRFTINGNPKYGAFVGGTILVCSVFLLHYGAVLVYQWRYKCKHMKAQAVMLFPSLSLVFNALFIPGYLTASWQWAFEESTIWMFLVNCVTTVVFVFLPLIYLVGVLYDDANFAAEFIPANPDSLRSLSIQKPFWSVFTLPGHWVSTDRLFTFHRRFYYCIMWYTQRRKYWFAVELLESALFAIAAGVTNAHPAVCFAELAIMFVLHAGFVIATFFTRPYQTTLLHWFTVAFVGVQALMLAVKLADIIKGETRFLEDAMYFVFAFGLMVIVTISLLTLFARIRTWYFQRTVLKIVKKEGKAQPRAEDASLSLSTKLLPERDEQGGFSSLFDQLLNAENSTMPLEKEKTSTAIEMVPVEKNDRAPIQSLDFNDANGPDVMQVENGFGGGGVVPDGGVRHVECKIELPANINQSFSSPEIMGNASFASQGSNRSKSSDRKGDGGGQTSISAAAERQQSEERKKQTEAEKAAKEAKKKEMDKQRNVWRLLALEEAKDKPVDPIKYDPDYDDLL